MADQFTLSEVTISDGHGGKTIVRPGDQVELPPLVLDDSLESYQKLRKTREYESNLEWLGKGPYTIESIKRWACGRVMLYLRTSRGNPGVYARDLQVATVRV